MSLKNTGFKFSIFLITFLLIFSGCRDKEHDNNTFIRVKVKESNGEMLYLEKITLDGSVLTDSGRVDKRGEVNFSFYTPDFEFFLIGDNSGKKILLLAEAGQEITIFTTSGKYGEDYNVNGSGGSSLLIELDRQKALTLATLDSLGQEWIKIKYDSNYLAKKELFDTISRQEITKHKDWLLSFIERYSESPATIIAAYQVLRPGMNLFTLEDDFVVFKSISESLGNLYPENIHVIDFLKRTEEYRKEKEAFEAREKLLQPGMPAPFFSLVNKNGEKTSLSSFTGKYVVIYFWDARRQECWEINRQLAELYQNYRYRGFEILGIYYGEDKQLFLNAIRIDGLPWVHLFSNTIVEKDYNVRNNPMMILVDQEGKIMHRELKAEELARRLYWIFPTSTTTTGIDSTGDVTSE